MLYIKRKKQSMYLRTIGSFIFGSHIDFNNIGIVQL